MSTKAEIEASGANGHYTYRVNGKVIAETNDRDVRTSRDVVPGAILATAYDAREARDTAQVIALAYAAGYNAGVADGAPVTERRARTIADEQIAKALDGLTVEVKR
ncbi:hypothetical protein ACM0AZ_15220 [Mycobacteroides abscessus subsp. massiliense]|uniref:hypothetical protein n=1 Tax=Mycobacteroides abscessus TaxID=36809 RepID=UPI001783BA30|nr:hypothetical protein [Mycobacteroides abscessus]QOF29662.1 hypothetical protein E3G43_003222 [Mycobacteroides abscessus]